MKKRLIWVIILMLAGSVHAETYPFMPAVGKRKMKVVRKYHVIVLPNQTNTIEVPAMFDFTGATNEQHIESSVFVFSVPPDSTEIKCRDYDTWSRKTYRLTWKKPPAITMEFSQELIVTLTARNKLCTQAKLPYPDPVHAKFKKYLGKDDEGDINPGNPAIVGVCKEITAQSQYAEQVVAGVCDWIADNIEWKKGKGCSADKALEQSFGNSYALCNVACSMLRKMGIPSDVVWGTYVGGSAYYYIEVYYPDAGWVFYDLACSERGFKSLDCAATAAGNYCVQNDPKKKFEWIEGNFFEAWDVMKYQEPEMVTKKAIRGTPTKNDALSVMVMHGPVPKGLPVRTEPLRNLMLDPNTLVPEVVEKKATDKDGAFDSDRPREKSGKGKE